MRTIKYIGRRLLVVVPQLFLISVITFGLVRMLPGDPARLELGPLAPEAGVELLRHQLRLDEPLPQQYIAYVERLLHGDFGRSWVNSSEVARILLIRAPATLELITRRNAHRAGGHGADRASLGQSIARLARALTRRISFGYGLLAGALPDFWLGLVLIFVFFSVLGWAPGPEGRLGILDLRPEWVTGFYTIDALLAGNFDTF